MPSKLFRRGRILFLASVLLSSFAAEGQTSSGYTTQGGEYPVTGGLSGDQVRPAIAVNPNGGYTAFQENDGQGLGVGLQRLDPSLSSALGAMRANSIVAGDQENPAVTLLKSGGAAVAWQGGKQGFQQIYARFLSANNTWLGSDIRVNAISNGNHLHVSLATLTNGNVVALWSSYNQAGSNSLHDVFAQRLSSTGAKLGGEFRLNQATAYNQRTPAVAPLANGGFVAVWVSELQRSGSSVDIFARLFDANGTPLGGEFLVNTASNICANPVVAAGADGGFVVAWGERDPVNLNNSWDVCARGFGAGGNPVGAVSTVNANLYGDQYGPHLAAAGAQFFATWTSLRQDGSWEGVFGRFLGSDGASHGPELQVNTASVSKQMHPCVAGDASGRFVVVWTSFIGGANSFDLFAQRYAASGSARAAPDSPFVSGLGPTSLSITWPAVTGLSVTSYEIYEDGASSPLATVTNSFYTRTGLTAGTTRGYRIAYRSSDGSLSPLSAAGIGTTWGADANGDGLPDDWESLYWTVNPVNWPAANADSDGDGDTNLKEFLAGTSPTDPQSVFKLRLESTPQGTFLSWNTRPGFIYQVETTANLSDSATWTPFGQPRFAAGTTDQVLVNSSGNASSYRVNRLH